MMQEYGLVGAFGNAHPAPAAIGGRNVSRSHFFLLSGNFRDRIRASPDASKASRAFFPFDLGDNAAHHQDWLAEYPPCPSGNAFRLNKTFGYAFRPVRRARDKDAAARESYCAKVGVGLGKESVLIDLNFQKLR